MGETNFAYYWVRFWRGLENLLVGYRRIDPPYPSEISDESNTTAQEFVKNLMLTSDWNFRETDRRNARIRFLPWWWFRKLPQW